MGGCPSGRHRASSVGLVGPQEDEKRKDSSMEMSGVEGEGESTHRMHELDLLAKRGSEDDVWYHDGAEALASYTSGVQ